MMLLTQTRPSEVDLHSTEARSALAKMIIRLFTHWKLSTSDQLELLGLSPKSRGLLAKYAKGEALPEGRDSLDRVGWLMSIHKSLRLLYPYNPEIRYSWVNRRNTAFNNLTPLTVMKEQGIIGLARVARYLDYYRGL
jgi:hypothetical protein